MGSFSIPYSDDLLVSLGRSAAELQQEFRFLLALKLFELRRVSGGKAAELAGMTKLEFLEQAAKLEVPTINLDADQLQEELGR